MALLFLQASGRIDWSLLRFPQSTGGLMLLDAYNATPDSQRFNLVALREEVYAIPQGTPFLHPARTELLRERGIFVAHSIEEAKRMIDAGMENIEPRLVFIERYLDYNLYRLGSGIFAVPGMDPNSGMPIAAPNPYREVLLGEDLESAKRDFVAKVTAEQ